MPQVKEGQFVYRVTALVPVQCVADWQEWMVNHHIPDVVATGCFLGVDFLSSPQSASEGFRSFVIEYAVANLDDIVTYRRDFAPSLQNEHTMRYGILVRTERVLLQAIPLP